MAMKCSLRGLMHSQHRTPVIPQAAVDVPKEALGGLTVKVGYLLARQPLVKSEPHPIESEMAYMLQREHQRYARHDAESYTRFLGDKEFSGDSWNRMDTKEIASNFFGLELYQDAIKTVLGRFKPNPRVTEDDYVDLFSDDIAKAEPPARYTINRKLDDFLFLIVKEKASGKWTIPNVERDSHETLKTTAQRAIYQHHNGALDTFVWSNAPQAVLKEEEAKVHTYVYNVAYLSGRPSLETIEDYVDHAWVTRNELRQYGGLYAHSDLEQTLLDIAPSGLFETP